ncbi:protein ULTRAPETALA 2-like [Amaranthus tricolor]|uniref:protein ULTRAPETALA 2-like n=1 Tax=Amaranthus tricolor TaxID=29722 RepID=UPI0025882E21|nr:protein ULTRAPETALA 2-like [Amaranthus tricolor]
MQSVVVDDHDDHGDDDEIEVFSHPPLFSNEELNGIHGIKRGEGFIELDCGCTNATYGDSAGKFRIYGNGKLEVSCDCYPGCNGEKLRPSEFEEHAGIRASQSKWNTHIWVFVNGQKVPLKETKLLKYYLGSATDPTSCIRPRRRLKFHRDEFIKCTACAKMRRFKMSDTTECRAYHEAFKATHTWTCSKFQSTTLKCEDEEERQSKQVLRGCSVNPKCKGCVSCVCVGCNMCRFADCNCRICVDFIQFSEP